MPCPYCNDTIPHNGKGCPLRKRSGKKKPKTILAWDCETVDDRIVLFLTAGTNRQARYLYSPDGLATERILSWLIETGRNSLNIGFFFDYDVNQILRTLPAAHLDQLRARGRVCWRDWVIAHIPGKRFYVRHRLGRGSVTIWDVSGWWQASFVRLCDEWKLGTEDERNYVRTMKSKRSNLSEETEEALVRYTTLECALLCEWFQRNLDLHAQVGVKLRAYSGAGSTAAAMIRARGWTPPEVPEKVQQIAEASYFGGRSETSVIGPVPGPVYSYDINSAYPAAISKLPEIRNARWHHVRRYCPEAFGFWKVRWEQPNKSTWGLFPQRGARLQGGRRSLSLLYPQNGEGWYHSYEVEAAMSHSPGNVEVLEGWIIDPQGKPFAWVAEAAADRLVRKALHDPAAFVLKVGLNSIYGKLAQHTGQHPLQCLVYAAAITAATRAALLRLMLSAGHDIVLVATDGILARRPLPVTIGTALGEWEAAEHPDAWILQAGVYWCGSKIRTRGIDARALSLDDVREAWQLHRTRATLTLEVRRVVSYRLACARRKHDLTGRWETSKRTISFSPAPRRRPWRYDAAGALLTLPAKVEDYQMQAALDEIFLTRQPDWQYDDEEACPHWSLDR